jgi:hypothetical protein
MKDVLWRETWEFLDYFMVQVAVEFDWKTDNYNIWKINSRGWEYETSDGQIRGRNFRSLYKENDLFTAKRLLASPEGPRADHSGRTVWRMNRLRPHVHWGHGFESRSRNGGLCALFCVYVVLCVGSGLATGRSPVQGILPTVYRLRNWKSGQGPTNDYRAIERWKDSVVWSELTWRCTSFFFVCLPSIWLTFYLTAIWDSVIHQVSLRFHFIRFFTSFNSRWSEKFVLRFWFYLELRHRVSWPYNTTNRMVVLSRS